MSKLMSVGFNELEQAMEECSYRQFLANPVRYKNGRRKKEVSDLNLEPR